MIERYLLEEANKSIMWGDHGFITYTIKDDELHIWDLFTDPNKRGKKEAEKLYMDVENLAIVEGCKKTTCMVRHHGSDAIRNKKITALHQRGFVIVDIIDEDTFLKKELNNG